MRLRTLCLAGLLLVLGGCSSAADPVEPPSREGSSVQEGTSTVESGRPCTPAPEVTDPLPASYPSRLTLPAGALVTDISTMADFDLVTGRVDAPVGAVLTHFRESAEPAGFVVIRDEDEGRAGRLQLFGATSEIGVTVARLGCPRGATGFTVQVPAA